MKTYTPEELADVLHKHQLWLDGEDGGRRADLTKANLERASLEWANLKWANLAGADLTRAKLIGANLTGADLSYADLGGADLTGAKLSNADLTGADLVEANLIDVDLSYAGLEDAELIGANLTGARVGDAPEVPNLCQAILTKVEANPKCLEMGKWHNTCGTTHCLAGWAVHLAGEAGRQLESKVGHENAGIAIFLRSHGSVPNFYSSNDEALEWIRKEAAK